MLFLSLPYQGIIDYTGMETPQFFLVCRQSKIFQELFTPTLNWITVGVQYMSSTPLILHAGLNHQLRRMQMKRIMKNDENQGQWRLFWSGTQKLNFRKIHLHMLAKAPIYTLSRCKAPKTPQVAGYKHTKKTNRLFHGTNRALTLTSAIILLTQVLMQKFPLLCDL